MRAVEAAVEKLSTGAYTLAAGGLDAVSQGAYALTARSSLKNLHTGSLKFEFTSPIFKEQPNGIRWYLQVFTGYAETLTDYNFKQTSFGAGVSFLQF